MFSRSITNEYGSYSIVDNTTILLKGRFDKNFKELTTVDPTLEQYKVFDSNNINFAIRIGASTYIPTHIFEQLKTAYTEGNPYFSVNDLITIDLDLSKTLPYINSKYGTKIETSTISYSGSLLITSASISSSVTQSTILVQASASKGQQTRFELAGVTNVNFQYYIDNDPNKPNDDNIINQIKFLFEDTTTSISGSYTTLKYQDDKGAVITQNLPASTDVIKPAAQRVTNLDEYLRDVKR